MKTFILISSIVLLAGCSMRDIVTMDGATTQLHDLNDNDTDGVIVARELCTDTVLGATIDNYGCGKIKPINERQELKILFPNDSFYIDPMYYDQVEVIATFMRQFPNTKVTIEGHTSKSGSYEHNLTLSQNRANAVTAALSERFGIESDRLTAIGYSFDRPVDFSETAAAQARNRRVIAEVTGEDTTADMKWNIYTVDDEVQ
ncbi:membrane protein [Shewanella hanedai]|jgi:outer membrane protein OmpA-like peptidoglycan-associated protein|uniref:OmpA family protein n=1 Tax=Shewanella hanedai TaxID=25 RepID=A0A553JM45_SHEHA|nr:OmpA family protein [Shewanella hanedai]TRY13470.1 OmpA family protein [Shewanella hanedai]GGI87415.1 membrane protein [Shewanella hanedai]